MEIETVIVDDNNRDDAADDIIDNCLNINEPKSFFMFAGAGSGKTRSLVNALNYIKFSIGDTLLQNGRKVAVITYTKAASEEIKQRASYNPLFAISTIHSFAWSLIANYTNDIRDWLKHLILANIDELNQKQLESRNKSTKAFKERANKIIKYEQRFRNLDKIKKFVYNPDGLNYESNSLDHAEVMRITTDFLTSKPTFKKLLIDKYPIVLIDESQDTNKELMNALLDVQRENGSNFLLGLFGDVMQRIYLDGKEDLIQSIPESWEKPCKVMNHRSQKRIVDLCNDIRKETDRIRQVSRVDKANGIVRLFIADTEETLSCENTIREKMSVLTADDDWRISEHVKILTIEHQMAASRLGFLNFYKHLNNIKTYKQGLVKGELTVLNLFTHILIPLNEACLMENQFEIMRIVKEYSILFNENKSSLSIDIIEALKQSVEELIVVLKDEDSSCRDLLNIVHKEKIFPIHKDLIRLIEDFPSEEDEEFKKYEDLRIAMDSRFTEAKNYYNYIQGKACFDTHQGVKGLEFNRVMVIIDDRESKGNSFSYDKLFGIEEKSKTDIRNENEGKETSIDRTRRLLYVTCSRAKESLAIVYYTHSVEDAYTKILSTGWFASEEIELIKT